MVKDGVTVIFGVLKKDSKVETAKQMPFFGSIPLLGSFFKDKIIAKERTELLIMLTPRIISGDVLVSSSAGKADSGSVLKPVKGYEALKAGQPEPIVDKVYVPLGDEKKLQFKGLKRQ